VRARAEQRRRRTLGVERAEIGRANVFADRRIGEGDEGLGDEDRFLARFQRERSRRVRKRAQFNLEDEEDVLTHGGQAVDDWAAGDGIDLQDDEAGETSDDEIQADANFGGGFERVPDSEANKTHAQVMAEVIAKSKMYKAERMQDKMLVEEKTARLDEKVRDFLGQLPKGTPKEVGPASALDADYDALVTLLASDKRAVATERRKTPEELAAEQREQMKKLEKQRVERMHGVEDAPEPTRRSLAGGDDLQDDFEVSDDDSDSDSQVDSEESNGQDHEPGVNGVMANGHNHTAVQSEDDRDSDDGDVAPVDKAGSPGDRGGPAPIEEVRDDVTIPYVYRDCPETYDDLLELFENLTARQRGLLLDRLMVGLDADSSGQQKRRSLLRLLLKRVGHLATLKDGTGCREVEQLVPRIHSLGVHSSSIVCGWARRKLAELRMRVAEDGPNSVLALGRLSLLRSFTKLFPATDFRHPVLSPCVLLCAETLVSASYKCLHDVVGGVFLASVLLDLVEPAGRTCSELVSFAVSLLASASTKPTTRRYISLPNITSEAFLNKLSDCSVSAKVMTRLGALTPWDFSASRSIERPELHVKVFSAALSCLRRLITKWSTDKFSSCRVVLAPMLSSIVALRKEKKLPEQLLNMLGETKRELKNLFALCERDQKPLALYKRRVATPKLLNPRFKDPDDAYRERRQNRGSKNEVAKLKKRVRSEERSAARELRRDAAFLSREALREQQAEDRYREKRRNDAQHLLEMQERTWKEQVKKKRKIG